MPTFSSREFRINPDWMSRCGKNKSHIVLLFFLVAFAAISIYSCIPYRNIDFQIMRPAQIKLGTNIDVVNIHCEYCSDSSQISYLDSENRIKAYASVNFIYSLEENLKQSPIFQTTKFSVLSGDSLLLILKDIKNRKNINGLVVVLDSIYLKDTVITEMNNYTYLFYTFGIIHKFGCRTYQLSNMQIIDNHLLEDTLFWPAFGSEWEPYLNNPGLDDASWDAAIKAGEAYAHYLAPYWTDKSRIFYYGYRKNKEAYRFIQKNELDSALSILKNSAEVGKSKRNISRILYNMAVIYELKDELEKARSLADSSYKTKKEKMYMDYTEQLRLRKLDKTALDWQLE